MFFNKPDLTERLGIAILNVYNTYTTYLGRESFDMLSFQRKQSIDMQKAMILAVRHYKFP